MRRVERYRFPPCPSSATIYIAQIFTKERIRKGAEKRMDPRGKCRGELTLVISLCVFWASSSALCWQEGSNRAKSAKSLSKDSLAAKSNLITSCWTSFACWILVAEPTHLVVVSYNDYENISFDIFFFLPSPSPLPPPFSRVCVSRRVKSIGIGWMKPSSCKLTIFPNWALLSPFVADCLNCSHGFPPRGALQAY